MYQKFCYQALFLNEGEWFICAIIEVSDETDDVSVRFMKQDKLSFV